MAGHGPARGVRCGAVRCRPLMSQWAGQSTLGPGRALVARPARALVGSCRGMAAALQLRCLLLPTLSTATHPTRRRRRRTASGLGLAGCIDRVGPRVAGSHSLTHSPSVTHQGLRSAEIAPEAPSRAGVRFQVAFPTPENWNQKARPGAGRQPPPNPSGGGETPISSRQPS